jgi:hypothetical protein
MDLIKHHKGKIILAVLLLSSFLFYKTYKTYIEDDLDVHLGFNK